MTIIVIHYANESLMKAGKITEHNLGFRAIHTDFTNNDVNDGYDVTYDNRIDQPTQKKQMTEKEFIEQLAKENQVELI